MAPDASNVQPVAMDGVQITITPQMAAQLGNPGLANQKVTAKVGQELTSMISQANKQYTTGTEVGRSNLITGQDTNLGPPAVNARPVEVMGPNGLPVYQSAGTAIAQGSTPATLSDVTKLTGQAATFANFRSNMKTVRSLLPAIDAPGATARISAAMAQPEGSLRQWIQGQLATGNLKPNEYDLINSIATLREDSFALRQFFGNSPMRSDNQVKIMLNQIPSVADFATGDSQFVARKLDNFERSVHTIEAKYGPLTSLINNPPRPTPNAAHSPQGAGGGAGAGSGQQPDFIMQGGRLVPATPGGQ
jgi:hypothetical protein